jgi:pathogenesis-related protein 1
MTLIQRCLSVLGTTLGLLFMLNLVPSAYSQSCQAECGIITEEGCACDDECEMFGDCCADKAQFCNTLPPEQPVGGELEPTQFTGTLAAHNAWRTQVGSANLVWNNAVATVAQQWANELAGRPGCRLEHRSSADLATLEGGLGENLYTKGASPNLPIVTPKEVVDSWGSEIQFYDSTTHTCNAPPGDSCGHYTQVVWSTTQEVGCGTASCVNGDFQNVIWVCNYRSPGNIAGQNPF